MKFIAALMTLVALNVEAKDFKIMDTHRFAGLNIEQKFEVNKELGRAWVEVEIYESTFGEGPTHSDVVRVQIEGLSYDASTKTINIDTEGQIIDCGKFVQRGRWIFKNEVFEASGRCVFEKKLVKKEFDDGFEIKTKKYLSLRLHVE